MPGRWSLWAIGATRRGPPSASGRAGLLHRRHRRLVGRPRVRGEDGLIRFRGRADAMIKTSGNRVSPTEVEEAAFASGAGRQSVALGVPDGGSARRSSSSPVPKGEDAEERLRA